MKYITMRPVFNLPKEEGYCTLGLGFIIPENDPDLKEFFNGDEIRLISSNPEEFFEDDCVKIMLNKFPTNIQIIQPNNVEFDKETKILALGLEGVWSLYGYYPEMYRRFQQA